ncbi:MAG TPA: TrmH family RNA methyltransferase [Methylomirabilota bacterium]|nr:TrmH family RNA methyltransferase [Methylomirabilota bacterium]
MPMGNLRVVLVATRNPLNIGAVARAMSNFGAPHLRVVQPYERAFREAKSAVGAGEVLRKAEEFGSVEEAVADCGLVVGTTAIGNREIRHPLRSLDRAGALIRKRLGKDRVAVLFGSEKWGLSNESLSYCHWVTHIPTRAEHQSMNLGQAAAVVLYELSRGERSFEERTKKSAARMEMVERLTESMLECLERSGYVAARSEALAEVKLRRMLRRFELDAVDAEVLLGMMKKVEWKLRGSGE